MDHAKHKGMTAKEHREMLPGAPKGMPMMEKKKGKKDKKGK